MRNVAEMLTVRAVEHNIKINVNVDDTVPLREVASDRLVQLVMILGDNAIKYSAG